MNLKNLYRLKNNTMVCVPEQVQQSFLIKLISRKFRLNSPTPHNFKYQWNKVEVPSQLKMENGEFNE